MAMRKRLGTYTQAWILPAISSMFSPKTIDRYVKPALVLVMLIPFFWLAWHWGLALSGHPNDLGFNPQETSNRLTGDWALRFLMLGLCLSPLSKIAGLKRLMLFRRMTGLTAFFYCVIHIFCFVALDKLLAWQEVWEDILKRPYITVGMVAIVLLLPLALTSSRKAVKRLGAKKWQRLHRLVYPAVLLGGIHFIMMRKGFQLEPLIYTAIILVLLGVRLPALQRPLFRRARGA